MKKQEMKRGKTMLITILAVIVSLSIIAWGIIAYLGRGQTLSVLSIDKLEGDLSLIHLAKPDNMQWKAGAHAKISLPNSIDNHQTASEVVTGASKSQAKDGESSRWLTIASSSNEDEILIQKYRFFQNLLSLNKIDIYSMVDSDNNIDFSAFVYEFINKYDALENNMDNLKQFFKGMALKEKDDNDFQNTSFFKAYSKAKTDFRNNKLEIGAYDYMLLKKNETFFLLAKICGIKSSDEMVADVGISVKILGIILHSTLEKIFKENWKNILQSSENLLISYNVIEDYLEKIISKEKLKIESFMSNYIKEVLIPRFVSNIEKFLKILYEELKGEKILRIQAEKDTKTEKKVYLKYNEIEVFLDGRADLLIETSKARYIIDFKTGGYNKEQLEFYEIMFYGSDNSLPVYSAVYNFWDEQESKKFKFEDNLVENLADKDREFKEFLIEFLKEGFYTLPKKSALKENNYDFNEYYRYKHIIPLEKMEVKKIIGDKDE